MINVDTGEIRQRRIAGGWFRSWLMDGVVWVEETAEKPERLPRVAKEAESMIKIETRPSRRDCDCCGYVVEMGSSLLFCRACNKDESHVCPDEGVSEAYCSIYGCISDADVSIVRLGPATAMRALSAEEQTAYTYCNGCFGAITEVIDLLNSV